MNALPCIRFGRSWPIAVRPFTGDRCEEPDVRFCPVSTLGAWLRGLLARVHPDTAVVALAAEMARMVWALLRHGSTCEAAPLAA